MKAKLFLQVIAILAFCSCFKEESINLPKSDVSDYENTAAINVDLRSSNKEKVYIFHENSHNNSGAIKEENILLSSETPVQTQFPIPKDVKNVIVIIGNKYKVYNAKDLIESGLTDVEAVSITRSGVDYNLKKIEDVVYNDYFPETTYNVKREDLYRCTDLIVTEDDTELFITYLGDGFFSKAGLYGKLWAYSYPTEKRSTLTVDDCTFYGRNGEIESFSKISEQKKGTVAESEEAKPIFWSKEEQPKVNYAKSEDDYTTIKFGKFSKGVSIGFVFKGDLERCQFTTPALNISTPVGNYEYIGTHIKYKDGDFTVKQNISNGFIYKIELEDNVFVNILGMDNRTPNHRAYDGDYNDMLCYVHSNPVIEPTYELDVPEIIPGDYSREKGLYLFEDNYPEEGDYDFNDVVVSYEIRNYFKKNEKMVAVQLLAKGSDKINQFGFSVNGEPKVMIKNIVGYKNVGAKNDVFSTGNYSEVYRETFKGDIKPFIHNGNRYIYDDTYFNEGAYPYVLIIPSFGDANDYFSWCINGNRIDEVYDFKAPRADDWYVTPTNDRGVVERTTINNDK